MNSFSTTVYLIKTDLERFSDSKASLIKGVKYLSSNASFKVTFWFSLLNLFSSNNTFFFKIGYFFASIMYKGIQFKTGIQLPAKTSVGKGLLFPHFSCMMINDNTIIGDNCTMLQGVTIGSMSGKGAPVIGNNVVIASGAKVIGCVNMGDNVYIGANAVVVKDVPANATVGGIPAKILNMSGKENVSMYI